MGRMALSDRAGVESSPTPWKSRGCSSMPAFCAPERSSQEASFRDGARSGILDQLDRPASWNLTQHGSQVRGRVRRSRGRRTAREKGHPAEGGQRRIQFRLVRITPRAALAVGVQPYNLAVARPEGRFSGKGSLGEQIGHQRSNQKGWLPLAFREGRSHQQRP